MPKDGECGIKDQPSYPIVKAKEETAETPEARAAAAFASFVHQFAKPLVLLMCDLSVP